jgi:hypothetical protein
MTTFYVVPDDSGYGNWSIKNKTGRKVQNAQTQKTAVSTLRRDGSPGKTGDTVIVYGNRKNQIIERFTLQ